MLLIPALLPIPTQLALAADRDLAAATAADRETERQILLLSQRERTGLRIVDWDEGLAEVARAYSARMAREGFVGHLDRDRQTPQDRVSWG